MNIFTFSDYKKLLVHLIENSSNKRLRSSLIEAMGCQKSFFSQVINGSTHLTPDHAANLVHYLKWDELKADYFMTLVNYERAGSPILKEILKKQLNELKRRATQPSEKIKWPSLKEVEIQSVYYSSWVFAAIHIIVSISKYQSVEEISNRLNLSTSRTQEVLDWLQKTKLIEKSNRGFRLNENNLHLKSSSHLCEIHHTHWRNRALSNLQKNDPDALHYSAVFAMSREDFINLKELAMTFIQDALKSIQTSKSEEIYSLGLDVFNL